MLEPETSETMPYTGGGNGHNAPEYLRQRWDDTRSELSDLDRRLRDFAKQQPVVTLAAVVLAGYLFGRLVSRL